METETQEQTNMNENENNTEEEEQIEMPINQSDSELSQEMEESYEDVEPNFPGDYSELEGNEEDIPQENQNQQENMNQDPRSNYLESLLQDQQEFVNTLESAENQLMLDENFILLISKVSNKNKEEMFKFDHRDERLESKWKY